MTSNYQQEMKRQVLIYADLARLLDEFHEKMRDLTISSPNKDLLTEQASKAHRIAEDTSEKITELKARALIVKGNTLALQNAVEKSAKYVRSYPDYIHRSISKERLIERAEVMLEHLDACRTLLNQAGSIDKSDTGTAIDRLTLLVENLKKANKGLTSGLTSAGKTVIVISSPYWTNPTYSDYQENIRQIVASYSSGRSVLARVLFHYDRGIISGQDRSDWAIELGRRRSLLGQLNNLKGEIPSGSIYREHHQLLQSMLIAAVGGMEQFASHESSSSRYDLSAISRHNSTIMNRLKAFYGIR